MGCLPAGALVKLLLCNVSIVDTAPTKRNGERARILLEETRKRTIDSVVASALAQSAERRVMGNVRPKIENKK
jgi:hypothetical protein